MYDADLLQPAAMHLQQAFLMGRLIFIHFVIVFVASQVVFGARARHQARPELSAVPGPWLARWSRLWIARALSSGRSHQVWVEVNAQYGSVARIGPNHVITDDPDITRRVLAARSGYVRGPWFDSIRIDPHISNIVSERNAKAHGQIRAKLAPSFSGQAVTAMEPAIDQLLAGWLDSLRKRAADNRTASSVVDIGQKIQFLTTDIITKICLGDEIGCVEQDRDMYQVLQTVEIGTKVCQYFSVFLELNSLFFQLARIPPLRRLLFPKPSDSTGVGRLMRLVHDVVEKRCRDGSGPNDVASSLLKRGMSKQQIDTELIIALVAGSDTTSTSVQSTLLAIITNPRVYAALRAEIREALSQGTVSSSPSSRPVIIQDGEARRLPYLQACVLEGLRVHPPLSQLRERVFVGPTPPSSPSGDDDDDDDDAAINPLLGRFRVPAGTFVGLNAWGCQLRRDVYGADAHLFRPERWLLPLPADGGDEMTAATRRLREMHRTHALIFGHGATRCLGASMAVMEIAKVIFELLRNFDIAIADPYRPWYSRCYGIFFQKNFNVHISPVDDLQPRPAYEQVAS